MNTANPISRRAFLAGTAKLGVAGLVASARMLGGTTFTRRTAYAGILANAFQVAEPPVVVVPANFYQNIGLFLILMSFVFYVLWYLLIARRLLQLASGVETGGAQ